MGMLPRRVKIPEGLRVLPDGSWQIGEEAVAHEASLRYFKEHLRFEEDGAFVVDGGKRVAVAVDGPPFEVRALDFSKDSEQLRAVLDDGSSEELADDGLRMSHDTGRFECDVRGGRARAVLSRAAHDALLDNAEEADGRFYVRVGKRLIPIQT